MADLATLSPTVTGAWNFNGGAATNIFDSTEAGLTATNPAAQGSGARLKHVSQVSTVGTATDCVTLPASALGKRVVVINDATANSMRVYTASGDFFNAAGTGTYYLLAVTKALVCYCYAANRWFAHEVSRVTGT